MIKSLMRFLIFTIPAYYWHGIEQIIFEDKEILTTSYEFFYRTEEKLGKDINTLENLLGMEQEDG